MFLSLFRKKSNTQSVHQPLVRRASENDFEQLVELFYEFYAVFNMQQILAGITKELLRVDDTPEFAKDTVKSYFDENEIIFVALVDNTIVGYISGNIKYDKHLLHFPEAQIIDWFVTKKYRKRGIGKLLYNTFFEEIKTQGCKSLSIEAFYQNTQTIKTYERMGFVKDSVILKKKI